MIDVYSKGKVTCIEGKTQGAVGRVFTFLVDGLLVDTGPQCIEEDLISFYKEHTFDLVALTHSHEDHSGTAPWIQENLDIPIYVHPKGIDICKQDWPYPKYRQVTWGKRRKFTAQQLGETIQSRHYEWKVLYTPGHAGDHVSFLNEETGILFSGDLFVAPKTKVIMDSESIPVIMDSIRTLLTYDFGPMYCCHAGYIEDGKGMLIQKLKNLENLCEEVAHLYREGLSIFEINQKLFPKNYPIITVSGGEWDSLHVVSSIVKGL